MSYAKATAANMDGAARDTVHSAADKAADVAMAASQKFDQALDVAETAARKVADQGRELGSRVTEVGTNVRGAVDKSLAEQPMTTLAIAAAAGFVLGALWKS